MSGASALPEGAPDAQEEQESLTGGEATAPDAWYEGTVGEAKRRRIAVAFPSFHTLLQQLPGYLPRQVQLDQVSRVVDAIFSSWDALLADDPPLVASRIVGDVFLARVSSEILRMHAGRRTAASEFGQNLAHSLLLLRSENIPLVELFTRFLEESYDAEDLLFFLYCRHMVRRTLGRVEAGQVLEQTRLDRPKIVAVVHQSIDSKRVDLREAVLQKVQVGRRRWVQVGRFLALATEAFHEGMHGSEFIVPRPRQHEQAESPPATGRRSSPRQEGGRSGRAPSGQEPGTGPSGTPRKGAAAPKTPRKRVTAKPPAEVAAPVEVETQGPTQASVFGSTAPGVGNTTQQLHMPPPSPWATATPYAQVGTHGPTQASVLGSTAPGVGNTVPQLYMPPPSPWATATPSAQAQRPTQASTFGMAAWGVENTAPQVTAAPYSQAQRLTQASTFSTAAWGAENTVPQVTSPVQFQSPYGSSQITSQAHASATASREIGAAVQPPWPQSSSPQPLQMVAKPFAHRLSNHMSLTPRDIPRPTAEPSGGAVGGTMPPAPPSVASSAAGAEVVKPEPVQFGASTQWQAPSSPQVTAVAPGAEATFPLPRISQTGIEAF